MKAIVQARANSTRLPSKMLTEFADGMPLFAVIIGQLKKGMEANEIYVATSLSSADDKIAAIAEAEGVLVFRGSEEDVLQRFIDCARHFEVNRFLRVCADNPLIQPELLVKLYDEGVGSGCDYAGFRFSDGTPSILSHIGLFAEYCTLDALEKVYSQTSEKLYREHVTNFIYAHPASFDLHWLKVPESLDARRDIRLTIDTAEDFEVMQKICKELGQDQSVQNILKTLDLNPWALESMKIQIESNTK